MDSFPTGTIRVEQTIPSDLNRVNRRRILANSLALMADKILQQRGAEPEGLIITVHEAETALGSPTLVITATVPQSEKVLSL